MSAVPMVALDRTRAQRMAALELANSTRIRRARLKRDMKAGRHSIVAVLADPPQWTATMKVYELVEAMPHVGQVKALKWLANLRISPAKTVGGLTDRQRGELIGILGSRR